uniref:Domain of unknown function DB domain-containing protein n=1 Tax=Meloidogyne enterolobii TaxID=390850 RepID=A0A6V7TIW8_MELEN|nr:unnamed protein product [Meloidogyne enterolobii]
MLFCTFCFLFPFILIIINNFLYCMALPPPPELSRVQLDCHRIPSSFCCSNRIRSNCAQLCASLPTSTASCLSSAFPSSSSSKVPTNFPSPSIPASIPSSVTSFGGSIDLPGDNLPTPDEKFFGVFGGSNKRPTTEGNFRNFEKTDKNDRRNEQGPSFIPNFQPPFQLILPPPDSPNAKGTPVPIEDLDSNERTEQTRVEPAIVESTQFPTLIPPQTTAKIKEKFAASIDSALEKVGNSEEKVGIIKTEGGAIDGTAGNRKRGNNRTKNGPLKSTDLMKELEELGDYEENKDVKENEKVSGSVITEVLEPHQPRTTVTEKLPELLPKNFSEFPPPPANQLWSFKIKPSSLKQPAALEFSQGNGSKKVDLDLNGRFASGEEIDSIVDRLFTNKELLRSFVVSIKDLKNKNNGTSKPSKNNPTIISSTEYTEQCSTPPKFIPCVPLEKANVQLHSCCVKRLMPIGCLPLCRYDTSRDEIKMAFEKGQCGILNISPFLECASQGRNNLNCCRHRQIAQNSAQQCEIFCTGEKLSLLGLQHLVCSTLIQPILECHHAGLIDDKI